MTLAARMMIIHYWEVNLTSIHLRKNDFTMMSLKKRQRSSDADDADLNVERKDSKWLRNTVMMIWNLFQIKISAVLQKSEMTLNQSFHDNTESMMHQQNLKKKTKNNIMN